MTRSLSESGTQQRQRATDLKTRNDIVVRSDNRETITIGNDGNISARNEVLHHLTMDDRIGQQPERQFFGRNHTKDRRGNRDS